jgi:hypothetical protein
MEIHHSSIWSHTGFVLLGFFTTYCGFSVDGFDHPRYWRRSISFLVFFFSVICMGGLRSASTGFCFFCMFPVSQRGPCFQDAIRGTAMTVWRVLIQFHLAR